MSSWTPKAQAEDQARPCHPYRGGRDRLSGDLLLSFTEQYGFIPDLYCNIATRHHLLIPILDPNGAERGIMEMNAPNVFPKFRRIWKAKEEPMISWTPPGDYYDGVYLVEDQISALKLWTVASRRVGALMGTNLSYPAVAEMQRLTRNVTIALDADATAQAFLLARRWGAAFKQFRVQVLTKDIKNMSHLEIMDMVSNE